MVRIGQALGMMIGISIFVFFFNGTTEAIVEQEAANNLTSPLTEPMLAINDMLRPLAILGFAIIALSVAVSIVVPSDFEAASDDEDDDKGEVEVEKLEKEEMKKEEKDLYDTSDWYEK